MTTSLQQRQEQAQKIANRSKFPVAVYNFNPFDPRYVLRDYSEGDEKSRYFVSVHYPQD